MFPRSPEHADVLPIIPEAVSVVMLAGTVAFWCHFALKSDLLTCQICRDKPKNAEKRGYCEKARKPSKYKGKPRKTEIKRG